MKNLQPVSLLERQLAWNRIGSLETTLYERRCVTMTWRTDSLAASIDVKVWPT